MSHADTQEALEQLRLNELQARYAEVVGTESRSPNKTFLIRGILEAQESGVGEGAEAAQEAAQDAEQPATDQEPNQPTEPASDEQTPLSKLSVDELRDRYLATLQRPTKSRSRSYLQWKIRQAEKGKVPVGPRASRAGEPKDCKVLPLRMETEVVTQLDHAWKRLGLKSRMAFFRAALYAYLDGQGEGEVAALFAPEG